MQAATTQLFMRKAGRKLHRYGPFSSLPSKFFEGLNWREKFESFYRFAPPVGGSLLSMKMKMAFSGPSLMRLRMMYTNCPMVKSEGTRYLHQDGQHQARGAHRSCVRFYQRALHHHRQHPGHSLSDSDCAASACVVHRRSFAAAPHSTTQYSHATPARLAKPPISHPSGFLHILWRSS